MVPSHSTHVGVGVRPSCRFRDPNCQFLGSFQTVFDLRFEDPQRGSREAAFGQRLIVLPYYGWCAGCLPCGLQCPGPPRPRMRSTVVRSPFG